MRIRTGEIKANDDNKGITSVKLGTGTRKGTLKLTVNGEDQDNVLVKGLGGGTNIIQGGGDVNLQPLWDAINSKLDIAFFSNLFSVHTSENATIAPNTYELQADNLEVSVGTWTQKYLSALGRNSSEGEGGGGTVTSIYLNDTLFTPEEGTITLPDYPTVPTLVSQLTNDAGYITQSALSPYVQMSYLTSLISNYYTKTEADNKFMTIAAFENLFAPLGRNDQPISHPYSSVNSIKALVGLWTEEYLSALGHNPSITPPFDREQLFDILTGNPLSGEYINSRFLKLGPNFSIDSNGYIVIDNVASTVSWNDITGEPPFYTKAQSDALYVKVEFFNKLFQAQDANGPVSTNDSSKTITSIKSLVGFWTDYYLSALGNNGSTVPSGINEQELWNILSDGSGEHMIDEQFIPTDLSAYAPANHTHRFADITQKPDTLEGYGINNAYNKTQVDNLLNQYLSKAFFNKLFKAHLGNNPEPVLPTNPTADASAVVDNIEALWGFWTNSYISALGKNTGAASLTLGGLSDVNTEGVDDGQTIIYDESTDTWIPGDASGLDEDAMWTALSQSGNQQIHSSHLSGALSNYVLKAGDTMIGTLNARNIVPAIVSGQSFNLGASNNEWANVYATNINASKVTTSNIESTYYSFSNNSDLRYTSNSLYFYNAANGTTKRVLLSGDDTDTTYYLTLNGTAKGDSTYGVNLGSFYAPTGAGTNNYVLKSNGSGAPGWVAQSTLSVGSATKATQDGDGNTISSTYLKLSGGTMTGAITLKANQYYNSNVYGLNLNNSDVIGANSIFFADEANGKTEGLNFINSSGTYDTIRAYNGDALFVVGTSSSGSGGTQYTMLHSGNYSTYLDDRYVNVTGDTMTGKLSSTYAGNGTWLGGVSNAAFTCNYTGNYCAILNAPTKNGRISLSTYNGDNDYVYLGYASTSHINAASPNSLDHQLRWLASSGELILDGHLWLNGANASSSTSNATQILFSVSGTEHVAISSNTNAVIINPKHNSTTGQIILGVNGSKTVFGSSGNFGIGTDSPSSKLTVAGTITPSATKTYDVGSTSLCWRWVYAQWMGSPNGETFGIGANDQRHLHIATNGNIGIGMGSNTPSEKLHVSGNILATGEITALSDIRQKSPISNVNTRIEDVANLPLFYFKWKYKDDDNMHIGTSAQAVLKLFPELVLGGEELSVNYGVLGTTLGILNARKLTKHEDDIKELKKETKALKKENKVLKERIKVLEGRA